MTQYPNHPAPEPWQISVPEKSPATTASTLLWILAAIQLMFFGCTSLGLGFMSVMPFDELAGQMQNQGQQVDMAMFKQVHEMAGTLAIMLLLITCVPAVIYAIMAYFIRQQNKTCMLITAVLLAIQTSVMGLMLASSLLQSLAQGNVLALLMGLIIFGIPVGLQAMVLYHLYQFKAGGNTSTSHDWNAREPWE
ncbi:MAG: hypothetical protein CMJ19_02105 [Phycisphaeraceae bacterium]|nr:hypothetical protein [Phycisphaeraceae bacterium]